MKQFTILILFISSSCFAQSKIDDGIYSLSYFIASEEFKKLSETKNDFELIDSLFLRSVEFFEMNYSDALLAISFATLPFKNMPLKAPVFNFRISIPLPSVSDSVFHVKVDHLPKNVFYDTPAGAFGDKDKLAHFFGNAFLSYNFNLVDIAGFAGIFVELFEESFKVAGGMSSRDLTANVLGEVFGNALQNNKSILPSQVLKLYLLTELKIIR